MRRSRPLLAASLAVAALALAAPVVGQEISFSGAAWYPVGIEPYDLALGDFDGDGILDAVTANLVSDTLTVRRGDGIGGLRPPIEIPVGDGPIFFATGHLNADPFCDLVVTHLNADGTWILLADGTGGFAPPVAFDPDFPAIPALVDLNLDGALDLVLATSFTGRVRSFLGDGAGGFGPEVGSGTVPSLPTRIRSLLLNADPWPDFLVLDVHSGLYAFLGSGSGTFPTRQYLGSYPSSHDLEVAQLNATVDTHLDVVISGYDGYRLTFLFGNGAGGFTSVLQGIPFRATDLAVGDWNGDGLADLAVGSLDTGTRTFHGDGSGGFILASSSQWPPVDFRVMAGLTTADLDLDGRPDLISPDYYGERLVTSLNNGTGTFTAGRTFPAGDQPRSLAVAPFDAVPGPDLLVGSYSQGAEPERGFRLLSNLGGGLFGPFTHFAPAGAGALIGAAAGDLDGDGDQDAVFAALTSPARVGIARGDGAGDFPDWSLLDPAMSPWVVGLGRFDSDPWPDLAVHGVQGTNGVALLAGDGAGGFGSPVFYAGAGAGSTVGFALADFDGDLDLDVAHPNGEGASFTVRLGDGAGGLGAAVTHAVTGLCWDVRDADLDGDLAPDLIAAGDRLTTFFNDGAGAFTPGATIVPAFRLHQAAAADFDGDGDLDVAVVGQQPGVHLYTNDGTGVLSGPTRFGTSHAATNLHAGDLDADGLPDLVTTLYDHDRVIVLRNNLRRLADLNVAVYNGQASAVPGEAVSFTVAVTNQGPALVRELTLQVLDTPPLLSPVFTPGEGSYVPATGAWTGLELRHGESVTLTLGGTIDPWATGTQAVSATAAAPAGVSDPIPANDTSWDEDALTPVTDLGLAKSDGQTSAVAGLPVTYTLTVTNHGPSAAPALTLLDPPPALLLAPLFTPQRGSYDAGTGAWSGALVGPGETITLTLGGTVDPGATGDLLVNAASLAAGAGATDPMAANDTASDVDALLRVADLGLSVDNGHASVAPGEAVVYTLTLVNAGPSRVDAVALVDTVPPDLLGVSHTPTAGSYDPGTGAWTGLGLAPGGSVTMTVAGLVDLDATGTLSYSAIVLAPLGTSDPLAANNVTADHDPIAPEVDLEVSKSDGLEGVWPGETVVYAIAVANPGPSHAPGTVVTDVFPAATLSGCTWACAGSGGATCPAGPVAGDISTAVDLPAGSSMLFTATCTATAAVATDPIVNTATATPAAGIAERDPADNSATDLTRPAALFADGFESGDFGGWSANGGE